MPNSKNYLIIGGATGIGLALSQQLIRKNHFVISTSRTQKNMDGAKSLVFDSLHDELPIDELSEKIDGLVYCPGSINLKPFHRLTDEDFIDDFKLNVLGAIKVIRTILPLLKNSDQASIVLFSTVAVSQGMPYHTSVACAKGAIEGLAKSLAAELAPRIRVNVIAPSLTDTPLAAKLLATEEKKKLSGDRHPLKRFGESTDIASLAAFLLSNDSSWITGQVIGADGGISTLRIN
jgi:NAD(P)-dependent dehydrogenase (short-subunit alcohol dehydrogenase family)